MRALRRALRRLKQTDNQFSGTLYAAAQRMDGVRRQQLQNLYEGKTDPWRVQVHTMNEICRVFVNCGIDRGDFNRPPGQ